MLWTVILLEGKIAKRAIGRFKTKAEAIAWAQGDGWKWDQFIVVPFHD